MSLKSFDKFCESIILNDPKSRKEIFDERQRQIRDKITLESLLIYVTAVFVNTAIMENVYMWCESYTAPMLLLMFICCFYWVIRNAAKGTLFGVNGTFSNKFTGIYGMFMSVIFGISAAFKIEEGEEFISNGVVSESLLILVIFVLMFVFGLIMFILADREDKRRAAAESEADEQEGGSSEE